MSSSRGKRRAEEPVKKSRSKKAKREETESESDMSDAGSDDLQDELAALAAEAPVITTGRRTRGIRIDYTKVEGFPKDEESAEDDEEVEEKPTKSPKSGNKASKGKQTKESARTGNRISHESRKPTAQKVKATPSKKRVIESEEEEEDDDDDQEGSDNENDDAEDN